MKITLTKNELAAILMSHYNLPGDIEVELAEDSTVAEELKRDFFAKGFIHAYDGGIVPHEKINAIKRLRELVPNCGLAQAKWAVEDWGTFTAYVANNGFPRMSSDDPIVWK